MIPRLSIIIILALSTLCLPARAGSGTESGASLYNRANSLYAEGKYSEAVELYEEAISVGATDPRLEYNIANAYLKRDPMDIGRAILHYERARLHAPRDPDLLYNLEYANMLIKNKPPVAEKTYLQLGWEKSMSKITVKEAAISFSVIYFILILFITLAVISRSDGTTGVLKKAIVTMSILLVLTMPVLAGKVRGLSRQKAVVMESNTPLRSGPGAGNPELFTLSEGMIVYRRACRDDWCQASSPGGMAGWIPRNSIELVTPAD